jgi:tRNA dimethylallyltransferase
MKERKIIVVAGPTGSGKSALSVEIAKSRGGEIVNSDSIQCYKELSLLTSLPCHESMRSVEHHLYGFLEYNEDINVISWCRKASNVIERILLEGKLPILTGGTGFYIKTLFDGISQMPEVSEKARATALELAKNNYQELCKRVYEFDERISNVIKTSQHRQMIRAFEIMIETKNSILDYFNTEKTTFLKDIKTEYLVISQNRENLYKQIDKRFDLMIREGAIDQVRDLMKKTGNQEEFGIFKAIGAKQIASYIRRECSFDEMLRTSKLLSRHYAKRQITWIKNQILNKPNVTLVTHDCVEKRDLYLAPTTKLHI